MSQRLVVAAILYLCSLAQAGAQQTGGEDAPLVLTATQATWSITRALTHDTPIRVINIPDDGRELAVLREYIERRKERFAELFSSATAVVALTNALPSDPLYRFARAANVRIVDIDAALPWTYDTPGVALVDAPQSDVDWSGPETDDAGTAPYFWLSISNTIRMADLVAADLARLFPGAAEVIAANLDRFKREMLDLRNAYQRRLIEAGNDTIFALTGDFVYLTNDMGLFVDGYFVRQDVRWTEEDFAALTAYLKERDIKVVIHKWVPGDAIQAAVHAAGAELIVLETGDPGLVVEDALAVDGLQQIHRNNLEKITAALSR